MSTPKNVAKKEATPTEAEDAKIPAIIKMMSKEKETTLSLDDRLHRLNVLFDIQKKYNGLQASLQKLNAFKLSHDNQTAYLIFRDDDRVEFTTSNTEVMQDFLEFVKTTIQTKIKALEPLLVW